MTGRTASPSLQGLGRRTALSLALGTLTAVAGIGVLAASGYLLSFAAERPPVLELMIAVVGVQAFAMTRAASRYAERLATHDAALRALARVRSWFVGCLEALAPGGLAAFREGDLLQRLAGDADELQDLLPRVVSPSVVAAGAALATLLLAGLLDGRSALVLGCGLLIAGPGVALLSAGAVRGLNGRRADLRAELASQLVEQRAMAAEIAAFGREESMRATLRSTEGQLHAVERRVALVAGLGDGLSLGVSVATLALTTLVAIDAVRQGRLPGVAIAALVLAIPAAFEPAQALPAAAERWDGVRAAWRRVAGAARTRPPVADPDPALPAPSRADLAVRDLWTRYSEHLPWALGGVDLDLRRGRRIAVVGPSAAGKSTLVATLVRFWPVGRGSITLDGVETTALRQHDVRASLCLVAQDAHLFNGSIRANLVLARPDATQAEVEAALRRAQLLDWVRSLPAGLDTTVGELGARISGGQRRRLALARGYLAAAPVLILDEPGAHLDERTADAITDDLCGLQGPPTLLLITHRLTGLEQVDEVLVLEEGRVVERGAPRDLLARATRLRAMRALEAS